MLRSDHQYFVIRSLEMNNYMDNSLRELSDFHKYSVKNNIKYSIRSGTALGFLTINSYLPWDDDIDISYKNTDYNKILTLWNSGDKCDNKWKDNNWEFRRVLVNDTKYYMVRLVGGHFTPYNFFKLIKDNNQVIKNQTDLGGLDIFPQTNFKNHPVTHELKFLSNPIEIEFSGIKTSILYDKQHIDELIRVYGSPITWGTHSNYLNETEQTRKEKKITKLLDDFYNK